MAQRSLYDLLNGENASGNPSLAEDAANPDAVVGRSRFIEYFVGGGATGGFDRTDVWDTSDSNSSPTFTQNQEGIKISTGSTATNSNFWIDWNDKRPFDAKSSEGIWTIKPEMTAQSLSNNWFLEVGMGYQTGSTGHWFEHHTGQTYINLQTSQGEGHTNHYTGVPVDNRWFTVRIENKASSCDMSLDGRLQVTATSGLQTSDRMQPTMYGNRGTSQSAGSVALSCTFRYFEAMNT